MMVYYDNRYSARYNNLTSEDIKGYKLLFFEITRNYKGHLTFWDRDNFELTADNCRILETLLSKLGLPFEKDVKEQVWEKNKKGWFDRVKK